MLFLGNKSNLPLRGCAFYTPSSRAPGASQTSAPTPRSFGPNETIDAAIVLIVGPRKKPCCTNRKSKSGHSTDWVCSSLQSHSYRKPAYKKLQRYGISVVSWHCGFFAAPALRKYFLKVIGFLDDAVGTNGKLSARQASIPPSSGRTLVIPLARSSSATRALVASLGHEQ